MTRHSRMRADKDRPTGSAQLMFKSMEETYTVAEFKDDI